MQCVFVYLKKIMYFCILCICVFVYLCIFGILYLRNFVFVDWCIYWLYLCVCVSSYVLYTNSNTGFTSRKVKRSFISNLNFNIFTHTMALTVIIFHGRI